MPPELAEVHEESDNNGEQHKRNNHSSAHVTRKSTLPQCVIKKYSKEGHHDHDDRAGRPVGSGGESLLPHIVNQTQQKNTADPGVSCPPPEPVKRARHQFRIDYSFGWAVDFRLKRSINPVEEVEVSDPRDSSEDVYPPEDCFQSLHDSSFKASR